ncbi:hypothetical protein Q9S36_47770, partial [Microbacterium sp. ARD31]|uniref:hypothetical protein n=1 Tax=Microbacterium sp. ARD31 TaxID=2962576 RepID=UPI00288112E9
NSRFVYNGYVRAAVSGPSIAGPRTPSVAQLYLHQAAWDGSELAFKTPNATEYRLSLTIPTPSEVLQAAVRDSGHSYEVNDKARQIRGAVNRGDDLGMYRHPTTVAVIQSLTANVGRDLSNQLRRLRESGDVSEESIEALRVASLLGHRPARPLLDLRSLVLERGGLAANLGDVMAELVARGHVEMGFLATCSLCGLNEFQPLTQYSAGTTRCYGCGSPAVLGADIYGSPVVNYRLSTLMQTVSLNGGLVPLAAVALLLEERFYIEPGVDISRDGAQVGELDLLGWQGPTLVGGEAKTSAAAVALLDPDAEVAKAAAVGITSYVLCCLEQIDETVSDAFDRAAGERGITFRLLDRPNLLAPAPAPAPEAG